MNQMKAKNSVYTFFKYLLINKFCNCMYYRSFICPANRRLEFESESQNDSRSDMQVVNSATAAESAVVSEEVLKSVPTLNA